MADTPAQWRTVRVITTHGEFTMAIDGFRDGDPFVLMLGGREVARVAAEHLVAIVDMAAPSDPGMSAAVDRYWKALVYIANRAPEYVPHCGPEAVKVARDAVYGSWPTK